MQTISLGEMSRTGYRWFLREADGQHHGAHEEDGGHQGQDEDGQQTLLHGPVSGRPSGGSGPQSSQ